jgi:rSAM/selenodomain-associated transferase 2
MTRLSIVIPTRRLNQALLTRIARLRRLLPGAKVIVVEPDDPEGGSTPSPAVGPLLIRAPRGRGSQCSAGARAASGDLLMFLHDDTELPDDAGAAIGQAFADPAVVMTCFRLRFDQRHWLLAVYGWFSRFESVWTTFGDQAMVVRRDAFDAVGGMPDWPLFEDVELARRLRRHGRVAKLPLSVTTSAARYRANGVLVQQVGNALRMLRFLLGTPPHRLAASYEAQPGSGGG